jgi:excisionase family DNA binding protein
MKLAKNIHQSSYLTKQQAAELLQISIRTLDTWMARRLIPYLRIGRTIRFRQSDLEENVGTLIGRRGEAV